jgi:hypothetical protein
LGAKVGEEAIAGHSALQIGAQLATDEYLLIPLAHEQA